MSNRATKKSAKIVINYTYDPLYRLTGATYSTGQTYAYSYDTVGNRLSQTINGVATNYAYDFADRLTSVNGVPYTWDNNGNLLDNGVTQFSYDAADRLISVSGFNATSYTYNGDGLRVAETVGGNTTDIVWDVGAGLPQILQEGNYIYAYGLELFSRNHSHLVWDQANFLTDGLGSVRTVTNPWTQQVADTYRYDPFGNLLSGGVTNNNRRFTGEVQDPTGLIYLRARYYDPTTGRFLTRDPFPGFQTLPETLHPYVYVANNPVNLTDPSGEIAPILITAGVGAGIGAAVGGIGYALAHQGEKFDTGDFARSVGIGAVSGAVAGSVGWLVAGLLPAGTASLGAVVGTGAVTGAAASGAGQITANLLTPCADWHDGLANALVWGAVSGGVSGGAGFAIRKIFGTENVSAWWQGKRGSIFSRDGRIDFDVINSNYKYINQVMSWARGRYVPHYHRRGIGGIGRHRPWEIRPGEGFFDRF